MAWVLVIGSDGTQVATSTRQQLQAVLMAWVLVIGGSGTQQAMSTRAAALSYVLTIDKGFPLT